MRRRRAVAVLVGGVVALIVFGVSVPTLIEQTFNEPSESIQTTHVSGEDSALAALDTLEVKGRAPKTGYERAQFGDGWAKVNGCSTRQIILYRDLDNVVMDDGCTVKSGTLDDPYSGEVIHFTREQSSRVQIDHVVALSDAWQKGAQLLSKDKRVQLANDPLELLAVSGKDNQAKSDADAATWLPKNKAFRCEYIARQIAVKKKYQLWVTQAEYDAMKHVLTSCPRHPLPK